MQKIKLGIDVSDLLITRLVDRKRLMQQVETRWEVYREGV